MKGWEFQRKELEYHASLLEEGPRGTYGGLGYLGGGTELAYPDPLFGEGLRGTYGGVGRSKRW